MKVKLPFKQVPKNTCKLSLFTWSLVESSGEEVTPICPSHVHSRIRSGRLGTDIVVVCEAGKHLIGLCECEEFDAEREEAKAKLIGFTQKT